VGWLSGLSASAQAALLRLARRIAEGFIGEVTICVKKGGGVAWVRWSETDDGNSLREELRVGEDGA
jgi:hypothetical protein